MTEAVRYLMIVTTVGTGRRSHTRCDVDGAPVGDNRANAEIYNYPVATALLGGDME